MISVSRSIASRGPAMRSIESIRAVQARRGPTFIPSGPLGASAVLELGYIQYDFGRRVSQLLKKVYVLGRRTLQFQNTDRFQCRKCLDNFCLPRVGQFLTLSYRDRFHERPRWIK